jgi:hypothetical protein
LDGAPVAAWLYFPGLKVGQISSLFFLLGYFDYKSLRITEYDYS